MLGPNGTRKRNKGVGGVGDDDDIMPATLVPNLWVLWSAVSNAEAVAAARKTMYCQGSYCADQTKSASVRALYSSADSLVGAAANRHRYGELVGLQPVLMDATKDRPDLQDYHRRKCPYFPCENEQCTYAFGILHETDNNAINNNNAIKNWLSFATEKPEKKPIVAGTGTGTHLFLEFSFAKQTQGIGGIDECQSELKTQLRKSKYREVKVSIGKFGDTAKTFDFKIDSGGRYDAYGLNKETDVCRVRFCLKRESAEAISEQVRPEHFAVSYNENSSSVHVKAINLVHSTPAPAQHSPGLQTCMNLRSGMVGSGRNDDRHRTQTDTQNNLLDCGHSTVSELSDYYNHYSYARRLSWAAHDFLLPGAHLVFVAACLALLHKRLEQMKGLARASWWGLVDVGLVSLALCDMGKTAVETNRFQTDVQLMQNVAIALALATAIVVYRALALSSTQNKSPTLHDIGSRNEREREQPSRQVLRPKDHAVGRNDIPKRKARHGQNKADNRPFGVHATLQPLRRNLPDSRGDKNLRKARPVPLHLPAVDARDRRQDIGRAARYGRRSKPVPVRARLRRLPVRS